MNATEFDPLREGDLLIDRMLSRDCASHIAEPRERYMRTKRPFIRLSKGPKQVAQRVHCWLRTQPTGNAATLAQAHSRYGGIRD